MCRNRCGVNSRACNVSGVEAVRTIALRSDGGLHGDRDGSATVCRGRGVHAARRQVAVTVVVAACLSSTRCLEKSAIRRGVRPDLRAANEKLAETVGCENAIREAE